MSGPAAHAAAVAASVAISAGTFALSHNVAGIKFNTSTTFNTRKQALLVRYKQALEKLEQQDNHLLSRVKRCRNCVYGGILLLTDSILLRICRMLAPFSRTDSAKDLLSLEVVSYDLSSLLRRSSHKALYPVMECGTYPQMNAREQFFHVKALDNVKTLQSSTHSCFTRIVPSGQYWVDQLAQIKLPSLFPLLPSAKLHVPAHSLEVILAAIEPTLVSLLKNAMLLCVYRMRSQCDQMCIVTDVDITVAQRVQYDNLCCGYMTSPLDDVLNSRLTLPISELDLSACVREMGYRAGIPRLAPSALTLVSELANQMLWTVLRQGCILAEYAHKPFKLPSEQVSSDHERRQAAGEAFEHVWTSSTLNHKYPDTYPTSAFFIDSDGKTRVIIGTDTAVYACKQLGYKLYGCEHYTVGVPGYNGPIENADDEDDDDEDDEEEDEEEDDNEEEYDNEL